MRAQLCGAATGHCADRPPTPPTLAAYYPGSGREEVSGYRRDQVSGDRSNEVSGDRWEAGQAQSAEEFLYRFGDAIDDRVADILDERDALRPRVWLRPGFAAIALLLAVIATILLRHTPVAACAVWLSTAIVCLAARTSKPPKP